MSLLLLPGGTNIAGSAAIPVEQAETSNTSITIVIVLENTVFLALVYQELVFVTLQFVSVLSDWRLFMRIIWSVVITFNGYCFYGDG